MKDAMLDEETDLRDVDLIDVNGGIMTKQELAGIINSHRLWAVGKGGKYADLRGADLRDADLRDANLSDANLSDANLHGANLGGADLSDANLSDANLRDTNLRRTDLSDANLGGVNLRDANLRGIDLSNANLRGTDLSDADLRGANLRGANLNSTDLRDADLRDADLRGANLSDADLRGADIEGVKHNIYTTFFSLQCPEEGSFIGWKKCQDGVLVKLLIPEDAQRSSATTRKCRASKALVLDVIGASRGISSHIPGFVYEKGKLVEPIASFNPNRWEECASGIHFFITREEAETY